MPKEYIKLDNFIRSYFNQDTVCELNSDDLGEIINLYLSEVGPDGVKQLLMDILLFINDNKNKNFDEYFERKFSSYLNISPADEFFSLLNSKYREKYPEVKYTVVKRIQPPNAKNKTQHRLRTLKKHLERVPLRGFGFSPEPIIGSAGLFRGKVFKRNADKRGAKKPHYVMVNSKPKKENIKRGLLANEYQLLYNSFKDSIEATDVFLIKNKTEKIK